jgi:hypothetical protein
MPPKSRTRARKALPLSVEELDRITSILGAQLRLRLVPGADWQWDRSRRMLMYPRERLLKMSADAITGYLWRTVQHAISSTGTFNEYDVAVDAVCATQTAADGKRLMHPHWVLQLVLAAERERVEHIARTKARNLGNSYLPVRGSGHRADEFAADRTLIADVTPDPKAYWNRAALALGAVACGALTKEQLPADMPWTDDLIAAITALPQLATYDELLGAVEALVPELARIWISTLVPRPPASEETGEAKPGGTIKIKLVGSGGAAGDPDNSDDPSDTSPGGEESDDSAEKPAKGASSEDENGTEESEGDQRALNELLDNLDDETLDAIQAALDELGNAVEGIDFFDEQIEPGTPSEAHETPASTWHSDSLSRTHDGPAWAAVSRSSATIVESLRRILLEHLVENEVGEIEYGTKSGRLNHREAFRPAHIQSVTPFKRRAECEERSYAISIVLDRSGSMGASTNGDPFCDAFGPGPLQRWHLTARLAVAFTEALDRLDKGSIEIGLITYDDRIDLVKSVRDPLSSTIKQNVMNSIRARGDNDDAGALRCALDDLQKSRAERRIIIHLTDGQFCSSHDEMRAVVREIVQAQVELVILTLDISSSHARAYVPERYADEVNDGNLARVLGKHLQRMLAA